MTYESFAFQRWPASKRDAVRKVLKIIRNMLDSNGEESCLSCSQSPSKDH
jgi:hypothetical protein